MDFSFIAQKAAIAPTTDKRPAASRSDKPETSFDDVMARSEQSDREEPTAKTAETAASSETPRDADQTAAAEDTDAPAADEVSAESSETDGGDAVEATEAETEDAATDEATDSGDETPDVIVAAPQEPTQPVAETPDAETTAELDPTIDAGDVEAAASGDAGDIDAATPGTDADADAAKADKPGADAAARAAQATQPPVAAPIEAERPAARVSEGAEASQNPVAAAATSGGDARAAAQTLAATAPSEARGERRAEARTGFTDAVATAETAVDGEATRSETSQTVARGAEGPAQAADAKLQAANAELSAQNGDGAPQEAALDDGDVAPLRDGERREPRLSAEASTSTSTPTAAAPSANAAASSANGAGAPMGVDAAGMIQTGPQPSAPQSADAQTAQHATNTHTPAPTPESQRAAQPVIAALRGREGGAQTIELRLDPPELGRVEIDLSFDGDKVVVALRTDRQDALDLLRRHGADFMKELQASGLDVGDMTFEQRDPSANQRQNSGDGEPRQNWGVAQSIIAQDAAVAEAAQNLAMRAPISGQHGMDLRV